MPLKHQLLVLAFTQNIFVVPKHIGGLQSIFNLKQFHHYMHIPTTFKIPTIIQDGNLLNKVIVFFLLISRILIYIFLLLSITIVFTLCLATQTLSVEVLPFVLATALRISPQLLNPFCSFAYIKVSVLYYIWMISRS